jgi:hypothetical protein
MTDRAEHRTPSPEEDGLARLVETEARLAEALASARAEADAIVQAARDEADAGEDRFQADLARDLTALAARHAARHEAELAALGAAAADRARRLRDLPDAVVDRLAAWIVEQLDRSAGGTA